MKDDKLAESTARDDENQTSKCSKADSTRGVESSYKVWLIVAGIILIGLAFRAKLLDAFFLDFDESMHFQVARQPTLSDAWHASREHTHPPLAFLVYHYWMKLGDSERMLRLPALLFSISALVLGFVWLKELLGPRPALVGLAFLTFSMPMVHLGALMRGYTLLLTFIFAALYLQERFLRTHSTVALAGSGCCLALAMLTHYSTAWLMLVLGLLVTFRVISGTLPRRAVVSWIILQFVLLGICVAMYFGHIKQFINSNAKTDLWDFWLYDSSYDPVTTHPVYLALMRTLEYIKYLSGALWMLIAGLVIFGSLVMLRKGFQDTGSKWIALERSMMVLLPLVVAMLLFHFRIYPVGHTRHSMWLIPFVVLGLAAATLPLVRRPGFGRVTVFTLVISLWIYSYAYPNVWKLQTTQTPIMARETIALLKKTVPEGATILTDGSTRNVLEYYLVGDSMTHRKALGGGYTEYQMAGYRVISIPKFHFFMYDIRADWTNFFKAFGENATKPIWVTYLGFEVPDNDTSLIFKRFPPGRLIKKISHLDNQILHVQFRDPGKKLTVKSSKKETP
ncbi:glycosyltransferase family 39 protein [Gimesia aquarii]|uniref:Glycosyltransferase RgtA/B/C/D-like domain-containing protein n=1 Tax=Gimesia aquarii TaxID=2527964 RepID=A0A517X187_9PLAN|nr:glycosyltransferase family 39 protein [Gimesia aquarii]QDU11259.1 hypothetical protein V202x_46780 [Gimesia aquarii]